MALNYDIMMPHVHQAWSPIYASLSDPLTWHLPSDIQQWAGDLGPELSEDDWPQTSHNEDQLLQPAGAENYL